MTAHIGDSSGDLRDVAATSVLIAALRAREAGQEQPLYRDEPVSHFLDPKSVAMATNALDRLPEAAEMVALRTHFFDLAFEASLRSGIRQFVLLGSGLDTRAIRFADPERRFYELDRESVLTHKKRILKAARYDLSHIAFLAGDYTDGRLKAVLTAAGLICGRPVHFHWEGNSVYVPESAFRRVLHELSDFEPGSRVSLDYMTRAVIAGRTGHAGIDGYMRALGESGAPWVTGFDSPEDITSGLPLQTLEHAQVSDLQERYRGYREAGFALLDFYRLLVLEKR